VPYTQLSPIALPGARYSFFAKTEYVDIHRVLYVVASDARCLNVAGSDVRCLNVLASDSRVLTVAAEDTEG